jgi:hypothetical protein
MVNSKERQSIALGVAMLIVWTAATIHVQGRSHGQSLAAHQMDIVPMMSHVGNLPVQATPVP